MLKSTLLILFFIVSSEAHSTTLSENIHDSNTVYQFTARLVEATPIGSSCEAFNYAVIQKFEVLQTNYPHYKKKFVLIIQPCPEQSW
jgi:hypothetical protein